MEKMKSMWHKPTSWSSNNLNFNLILNIEQLQMVLSPDLADWMSWENGEHSIQVHMVQCAQSETSTSDGLNKYLPVHSKPAYFIMPDLPMQVTFRRTQISLTARAFQRFDPVSEFMRENRLLNLQSWGALINTFYDLELGHIFDHLHKTTDMPVRNVRR